MSALVAAVLGISACSAGPPDPSPVACIGSGSGATISEALVGPGAEAVLCPGSVFALSSPIKFTARDQQIYTDGRPTDDTRALLQIASEGLEKAVDGVGISGVVLESVQIDGALPAFGRLEGDALIELGGDASGQTVRSVFAYEPRSWSTIHFFEGTVTSGVPGCQGGVITGNTIGPAGRPGDHQWADGISLACGTTLVEDNVITDATDGAIVIFGAPGSTIRDNTIIAQAQILLGGINMVDHDATSGNYENTIVSGNTIDARGALIKVAIGMGPQIWACWTGTNFGATVTGNTLRGDHMGYGYAISGVRDWTVSGNIDSSHHVGRPTPGCTTANSAPEGFQVQLAGSSGTTLQSQFAPAELSAVLGLFELGDGTPFGCSNIYPGQLLRAGESFPSCDGRILLMLDSAGGASLRLGSVVLWSPSGPAGAGATFTLQDDGNLVLADSAGGVVWASGTAGHPGTRLQVQDDGNLVLLDSSIHPIWASNTSG